ncbi:MAG TPA: hypothetical protein VJQ80_09165 [Arthrobacter sp.]|nr:hypothetical protein [Arthrobacter sp.]
MSINSPDSLPEDEPQEGKAAGKGNADGGIPGGKDGVGISDGAEPNTFEPEEDPDASAGPAD